MNTNMKIVVFFIVAVTTLGTVGIIAAVTTPQAYAAVPACDIPVGCTSPGQHVNTQGNLGNTVVGNPHYPQIGGATTGDPHGATGICNSNTGNPHATNIKCN
jgi:hypothetical protein